MAYSAFKFDFCMLHIAPHSCTLGQAGRLGCEEAVRNLVFFLLSVEKTAILLIAVILLVVNPS